MKITDIEIIPLNLPMAKPTRNSFQSRARTEFSRVVVKLLTDEGHVGWGESWCGRSALAQLELYKPIFIGQSPFNIESLLARLKMGPYWAGYSSYSAMSAIEIACWDLMGKSTGLPVHDLIGGRFRDEVEFAGYLFYRVSDKPAEEEILDHAEELMEKYSFRTMKVKAGVFSPRTDLDTVAVLRERFGDDLNLRVDPNGAWSPADAIQIAKDFEPMRLQFLEDPCWGIEGMARLRKDVRIPFATNMFVVEFDHIPVAYRLGAVDIILADAHKWGGILATKKLAATCSTLNLGVAYHSGGMLGISMAVALHLAASTPAMSCALDSHYHHMLDDVIAGDMFQYQEGGTIAVPTGPGLGIELDEDKLRFYAERFHETQVVYDAL